MKKSDTSTIGGRLREIRLSAGLTQREMGDAIDTTRVSINGLETGHFLPTIEVMRKLNKRFGASYRWIIDGIEDKQNDTVNELMRQVEHLKSRVEELTEMNRVLKEFNQHLKAVK